MNIQAIIMDVDGTLTNSKKQIPPKTKESLMKAQQAGIRLVLASGRPTSGLVELAQELQMEQYHGLLVSYNGSCVIDCSNNEVLFNQAMSVADCKEVLEHVKQFDIKPMIDKGNYMYVNDVYDHDIMLNSEPFNVIKYEARGGNFMLCEKADLAAFVDFEINKILTAATPEYLQEHYQAIQAPFMNRLHCVFTSPFFFEFTAKGVDKAKALDVAFSKLGINKEYTMGFGDGHNDASMLHYVKHSVAMANAVDELKDFCSFVTKSNDDEGIDFALRHFKIIK